MARNWTPMTDEEFARQNDRAIREARAADRVEPRADMVSYDAERGLLLVELKSGVAFGFPPERVPGLEKADAEQLSRVRISPSGDGLLWDELDAHASLTGLMVEALNLLEWAPRLLGQRTSAAKAEAARINGRRGGRPAKTRLASEWVKQIMTVPGVGPQRSQSIFEHFPTADALLQAGVNGIVQEADVPPGIATKVYEVVKTCVGAYSGAKAGASGTARPARVRGAGSAAPHSGSGRRMK